MTMKRASRRPLVPAFALLCAIPNCSNESLGTGANSPRDAGPGRDGGANVVKSCTIDTPTHWAAGVYVADCPLRVESSLTLDPGVIVKFGPSGYVDVRPNATLTAAGTSAQPIVFTSLKDDDHGGDSGGDGASVAAANDWGCRPSCGDINVEGDGTVLDHVQVLYGASGVYVKAASVHIEGSVFAHSQAYGLVLDGRSGVETTTLTGNAFFDNHGYPLRMGTAVFLDGSNLFHDPANPDGKNAKQCVELDADIERITVLGVTELAFLYGGHAIRSELLLPPGVIFKTRDAKISLEAGGSLLNGPNMVFTSYRDDSSGGDCTGDGDSKPAAGDWDGVWVEDETGADYAAPSDSIRYAAHSGTMQLH